MGDYTFVSPARAQAQALLLQHEVSGSWQLSSRETWDLRIDDDKIMPLNFLSSVLPGLRGGATFRVSGGSHAWSADVLDEVAPLPNAEKNLKDCFHGHHPSERRPSEPSKIVQKSRVHMQYSAGGGKHVSFCDFPEVRHFQVGSRLHSGRGAHQRRGSCHELCFGRVSKLHCKGPRATCVQPASVPPAWPFQPQANHDPVPGSATTGPANKESKVGPLPTMASLSLLSWTFARLPMLTPGSSKSFIQDVRPPSRIQHIVASSLPILPSELQGPASYRPVDGFTDMLGTAKDADSGHRFTVFDVTFHHRSRQRGPHWTLMDCIADAVANAGGRTKTVQVIERPMPALPGPQITLTAVGAGQGYHALPLDLRAFGFDVYTFTAAPGHSVEDAFEQLSTSRPGRRSLLSTGLVPAHFVFLDSAGARVDRLLDPVTQHEWVCLTPRRADGEAPPLATTDDAVAVAPTGPCNSAAAPPSSEHTFGSLLSPALIPSLPLHHEPQEKAPATAQRPHLTVPLSSMAGPLGLYDLCKDEGYHSHSFQPRWTYEASACLEMPFAAQSQQKQPAASSAMSTWKSIPDTALIVFVCLRLRQVPRLHTDPTLTRCRAMGPPLTHRRLYLTLIGSPHPRPDSHGTPCRAGPATPTFPGLPSCPPVVRLLIQTETVSPPHSSPCTLALGRACWPRQALKDCRFFQKVSAHTADLL